MSLPKAIRDVVAVFERLPGIGPKSATRLAFYLLNVPDIFCEEFSDAIGVLKKNIKICKKCFSVADTDLCKVCADKSRNEREICVVDKAIDMLAIERMGVFKGVYHVLGGVINPLEHVGPEDIKIFELLERVRNLETLDKIEVLIATSLTMEGEATALYIKNRIEKLDIEDDMVKITRIGSGLPVGADLEYADEATLSRAMNGRKNM
ncbi:recombination mediator RecR [Patescibacteria group bacterium]|nr:recombination mediator RecR [Patescibacteria group bacterium]MCG2701537.1 recombination mediator RecR [Candidatus Parcubacteria bacterium]MBU4265260.1 recombination mediator RecR [Patescibacteria group bacterium]MBU4389945.1 recombination mediator RecR [Patescibacteria group bacterium]MBU4397609.1 recombination mediator RecR [Patescibacteria group bacterium]